MPTTTILGRRNHTIQTKTKYALFLILMLLGLTLTWKTTETYAQGSYNRKLQLSPTSGYEGTDVDVSMNVVAYFEDLGYSDLIPYYLGKSYRLVWDPLSRTNTLDPAILYTPHNLPPIGTATIDEYGMLYGTANIPWEGSAGYGEHYIYAVYEENSGAENYLEWWWATFNYVAPPTNRYTVEVTVQPAGAGSVTISPDESSYPDGTPITLTAHENYGWTFSRWSGDFSSYSNPEEFYIALKNYQITAIFTQNGEDGTYPTPTSTPGPCSIAAALLGGPLYQEVAFTRHVRDDLVGSNDAGQTVVKSWNTFYYSWSPPITYVIASSSQIQAVTTVLLMPLLGTIHLVELQYNLIAPTSPEIASILSFGTAAILSTAIYIVFPAWLIYSLLKPNNQLKQIIKRQK